MALMGLYKYGDENRKNVERKIIIMTDGKRPVMHCHTYLQKQIQGLPMLVKPPFCSPCLWENY